MKNWYLIIISSLFFTIQTKAQIVTVRAAFESDSVMLGEQLIFTMTAESEKDVMVTLPQFVDSLSSQIEILNKAIIDTSYSEGRKILTQKYLVASYEPGWNTIPPQPVAFSKGDLYDTVYTTASLLTVLAPEVDTTQAIRPIKGPVNTPVSFAEIFPWVLAGWGSLMILTLVAALFWIYFQKEKNPEHFNTKPLEPAHIIAFRELQKLRESKLADNGRVKEYYSNLTLIIRVYITRLFGIHALESTTSEILDFFRNQNTGDKKLGSILKELLLLADLVKFAKEDPSKKENDMHFENAHQFVENTYRMFYTEETTEGDKNERSEGETGVEQVKIEENNG